MAALIFQAVASYAVSAVLRSFTPTQKTSVSQEGPRLTDLKIQSSAYGGVIPRTWGTVRLAGNMIWSRPIKETTHTTSETQSSGGKGGGGGAEQTVTTTTYSYSQTFAIALKDGQIAGVRKIWANGTLIYNSGSDADLATLFASNSAAAGIQVYLGTETQLADPVMQAFDGVASTPAYRGTAYIVFTDLQLADYGNRAPSLEFEISSNDAPGFIFDAVSAYAPGNTHCIGPGGYAWCTYGAPTNMANRVHLPSGAVVATSSIPIMGGQLFGYNTDGDALWSFGTTMTLLKPNGTWSLPVMSPWIAIPDECFGFGTKWVGLAYVTGPGNRRMQMGTIASWGFYGGIPFPAPDRAYFSPISGQVQGGYVYYISVTGDDSGYGTDCIVGKADPANSTYTELFNIPSGYVNAPSLALWLPVGRSSAKAFNMVIGRDGYIYIANMACDSFSKFDESGTIVIDGTGKGLGAPVFQSQDGNIVGYSHAAGSLWTSVDPMTLNIMFTGVYSLYGHIPSWDVWSNGFAAARDNTLVFAALVAGADPTVASIITDICAEVGLSAGDIDVSSVSDTVGGYIVAQRQPARSSIEPLQQMYFIDATESDSKVKFVKRGGAVAVVIPEADLAAHQYGQEMPDQLLTVRQQEVELPREVAVSYQAADASYQTGTQYSRRLITDSSQVVDLQFTAALTDTKAKQIADVLTYSAWTARNQFTFANTRKYSYLDPTDVVQFVKGATTYTARLTGKDEAAGITSWEAEGEDASIYTQTNAASTTPAPPITIEQPGITNLQLMDAPLLRDADDGPGFYMAAAGYLSGWKGAQVFKSTDGASWGLFGPGILNGAVVGYAMTVLATHPGGNTFDEKNTVSIVLAQGSLASVSELDVLNGSNAAYIGGEVIQFKNAALTAANTYTLSGLLRGRKGTDRVMGSHAIGDQFVLLTSLTVYRVSEGTAEIGLARQYKAASFGTNLNDAQPQTFTDTGVCLKPYAPVLIGAGRDASGNITLNWTRRTRVSGEWRDYVDAALGEATEAYSIDIMSGTTVKRTLTSTTPTVSYTAANQTTDFGAPQSSVLVNVYQISATIGRGFAGVATV